MKIFSFTSEQGHKIDNYGSITAYVTPIILDRGFSVVTIRIEAQGELGAHPAAEDQLFLVTAGEGYVSADNQPESPIGPGSAVFWQRGEHHRTRAGSSRLMAVVIEGEGLGTLISLPPDISSS